MVNSEGVDTARLWMAGSMKIPPAWLPFDQAIPQAAWGITILNDTLLGVEHDIAIMLGVRGSLARPPAAGRWTSTHLDGYMAAPPSQASLLGCIIAQDGPVY